MSQREQQQQQNDAKGPEPVASEESVYEDSNVDASLTPNSHATNLVRNTSTSSSMRKHQTGEKSSQQYTRRNQDFHALFRSVPDNEQLIDTYSCALNREILVHGRLYLSANYACFNANILGWITNVVISLKDVVAIEKKSTAFIIPNAIQISTLHHRYFFASFMWRDDSYTKITLVWKNALALNPRPIEDLLMDAAAHFSSTNGGHAAAIKDTQKFSNDIFADDKPLYRALCEDKSSQHIGSTAIVRSGDQASACSEHIPTLVCGCDAHFDKILIEHEFLASLSWLQTALFGTADSSQSVLFDVFTTERFTNICVENWRIGTDTVESRQWLCLLPLPRVLTGSQLSSARAIDSYLLKQPSSRFIVESNILLQGIPGGDCLLRIRHCMTSIDYVHCKLLVTIQSVPPKDAWFKESIKQALITQWEGIYTKIVSVLSEKAKNRHPDANKATSDQANYNQRQSTNSQKGVKTKSNGWTRIHQHGDSSSISLNYFDWSAFWHSIRRIATGLAIIIVGVTILVHLVNMMFLKTPTVKQSASVKGKLAAPMPSPAMHFRDDLHRGLQEYLERIGHYEWRSSLHAFTEQLGRAEELINHSAERLAKLSKQIEHEE